MSENVLDRINIAKQPLQAFDLALTENRKSDLLEADKKKNKKILFRCILSEGGRASEAEKCDENEIEDMAKSFLDKFHEMTNRDHVSACYIRLLSEDNIKWAQSSPWRPKIIDAIDSVLSKTLYKEWKIDSTLQPHEKVPLLVHVVKNQEKELHRALGSLTSLDNLNLQRQKLMSCINNKTGQFLLKPFLPLNIDALLSDVYNLVQYYLEQKESIGVMDAYIDAKEKIDQVIGILHSNHTEYCLSIADALEKHLLMMIEESFSNNQAARPASVIIEAQAKKHPLHHVGGIINIGILVKNLGPGYSYETELIVVGDDSIELLNSQVTIGRLPPSESQIVNITGRMTKAVDHIDFLAQTNWTNFNREKKSIDSQLSIEAQRNDLDWNALSQTDPYSLEPIEDAKQLVGRKEVLNKILGSLKADSVGSFYMHGQKRVGKTSIAKVLQTQLTNLGYISIYLESGDYVMLSATATVNRLGTILCKKIISVEPRAAHINVPSFDEGFSPITDFLDDLAKITQERRIVIILDEFDRLPYDLYIKGPWGDSFFQTLRSITSRHNIGFIMIGAERMVHIMDSQGVQLNKWGKVPVDYFSRDADWEDYQELIQRPSENFLEFTEDAILSLHDLTSGNPYFTKLICQFVFRNAISSRDCYITRMEIEAAVGRAIKDTGENAFQHFWEDRIFETGEKANEKSVRRRKILIAISDSLQKHRPASGKEISSHPLVKDMVALESDLKEFATRQVVIGNVAGKLDSHQYDLKVEFFYKWLKDRGIQDILASFSDLDAVLLERQNEEQLKVQSTEIVELVESWGDYRGQKITTDKVRAWLEQFPEQREQRAMFRILTNLHFYSNSYMRSKMKEIHDLVVRGLGREKVRFQRKRSDIVVSYLDKIAKSGADFASLYAEETGIYFENVIEKPKLLEEIKKKADIKVVIFIDDFVGTGDQASGKLKEVSEILGEVRDRNLKVIFIAVVATKLGWAKVSEVVDKLSIPIEIRYCEILSEADQVFGDDSKVFSDVSERDFAKITAEKYGRLLLKNNPLGYGGVGVSVVFERSCPNGTLPILWAENQKHDWVPLFKRL